jgi:uncharacterized NAD(P)/FAD-binding protein YdhS
MAPELWHALLSLISDGRIRIAAGRLTSITASAGALSVHWRVRRSEAVETLAAGAVINCVGPESDVRRLRDPLVGDLLRRGLATCDAAGLGLRADASYRMISSGGTPSPLLSLTGPLLKGEFWEATAVPELRVHAARLAERLTAEIGSAATIAG